MSMVTVNGRWDPQMTDDRFAEALQRGFIRITDARYPEGFQDTSDDTMTLLSVLEALRGL